MEENEDAKLDMEYKRYLQIMRPHLGQLLEQDAIDICNAWIQKLSNCKNHEKCNRNKYVFALCYQLAKGILDKPFIDQPPEGELLPFYEGASDVSSSEVEYHVIDSEEESTRTESTKVIYNARTPFIFKDCLINSAHDNINKSMNRSETSKSRTTSTYNEKQSEAIPKQTIFCYMCPEIIAGVGDHDYKYRVHNLISKLREIKEQNMLLQTELEALKEESRNNPANEQLLEKVFQLDMATSTFIHANESTTTINSLRIKLKELQDARNVLIETVRNLHDVLNNFEEMKKHEMGDIEAKHKLEVIQATSSICNEIQSTYENKIEDLKREHTAVIKKLQENTATEIQEITINKEQIIIEKEEIIKIRDNEIARLKVQLEKEKHQLQSFINDIEKPEDDNPLNMKTRTQQLEKRLSKAEKARVKCIKAYESKLACMQREKHLAECSLQLQLLRQRAQVVNEATDENQTEFSTALDKLETKYKEIVANMQATAIHRRLQDQMAIESILEAACSIRSENPHTNTQGTNRSELSGKIIRNQNREENRSYETEVSSLYRGNKVSNVMGDKSFGEDSVITGYCLDRERLGELFQRVYIPQRDTGDRQK